MASEKTGKKSPSTKMSFTVFGLAISALLIGVIVLKYDLHIVLLFSMSIVCIAAKMLGYKFDDFVSFMKIPLGKSLSAMIIFIFIGIIIASWIYSGTVPTLIYYGLQYITPKFFLPLGLILCSITSLSIGTSWGTIGTMGIAMMGIGAGMGVPAPVTAGMVISGAFFGDKMSPMSDTTNLAPASAGTTLHKHINAMWFTTLPAYILTLLVFTIMGLTYKSGSIDHATIQLFSDTLKSNFVITPIVLIPVIVLFALNILKFPAIPGMAIGSLLAVILAVTVQGTPIAEVITGLNYGYVKATGIEIVDTLILRGGIQSMMYTFSLAFIAISFGGLLEHTGFLPKIISVITARVKSERLIAPLVILCTTLATLSMGEVYLAIVVTGSLFRGEFKNRGLRPEMLSRLLEEGGTLTQVFIPWSTTGVFIAATLGVGVSGYWCYALLNLINPLLSILLSLFGIGILREKQINNVSVKEGKIDA